MTPPVSQWSAGSCSLSRWSEVFGEVGRTRERSGKTSGSKNHRLFFIEKVVRNHGAPLVLIFIYQPSFYQPRRERT